MGGEDPLRKLTANHSSSLAWRITWIEEPCGLQSMGLQRVGHGWQDLAHIHTRRTPRSFPNTVSPELPVSGSFKLKDTCIFMKRLGHLIGLQNPSFLIKVRKVRKAQHIYPLSLSWSSGWALQTNLSHFNGISNVYNWYLSNNSKFTSFAW